MGPGEPETTFWLGEEGTQGQNRRDDNAGLGTIPALTSPGTSQFNGELALKGI